MATNHGIVYGDESHLDVMEHFGVTSTYSHYCAGLGLCGSYQVLVDNAGKFLINNFKVDFSYFRLC